MTGVASQKQRTKDRSKHEKEQEGEKKYKIKVLQELQTLEHGNEKGNDHEDRASLKIRWEETTLDDAESKEGTKGG